MSERTKLEFPFSFPQYLQSCAFCGNPPSHGAEAEVTLTRTMPTGVQVVQDQEVCLKVPRCKTCQKYHNTFHRYGRWLGFIGLPIGFLLANILHKVLNVEAMPPETNAGGFLRIFLWVIFPFIITYIAVKLGHRLTKQEGRKSPKDLLTTHHGRYVLSLLEETFGPSIENFRWKIFTVR